jgi:hypothetical protein
MMGAETSHERRTREPYPIRSRRFAETGFPDLRSKYGGEVMDVIKAAKNQALFREVNERIRNLDYSVPRAAFVCECVRPECSETIEMSLAEYEEIRRVPNHFLVAAGKDHFFPDVERIFETYRGYWVVEKFGQSRAEATRLDPRSRAEI